VCINGEISLRVDSDCPFRSNCVLEKVEDELQIAVLRFLLNDFPNLPLPPPPDPNVQLAGPYAYNPECRLWKCAIKCQVIDFSGGYDNAKGYVTVLGAGKTEDEACRQAEANGNDAFNPFQPQHRVRHCNKKTRITWR